MILSLYVSYPITFLPTKQHLSILILKSENPTKNKNIILTILFVLATTFVSVVFPKIDKVISLMGGLFASTIDFLIPIFCYYRLSGATKPSLVFFGTLTLIGYSSVLVTLYQMVYSLDTMPRWIKY